MPPDTVVGHLKFALKHEPLDLGVVAAVLKVMDPGALEEWVRAEPTGAFARRAWFFYERLTKRRLDLPDLASIKVYTPALDPELHVTVPDGERSPRHKVIDNLLGVSGFCPTVRLTPTLKRRRVENLPNAARALLVGVSPEVLTRAVNYLYTKETMSSFQIEGETAQGSKAERFVAALRQISRIDPSREADLVGLQNLIVDRRYAVSGYRTTQVFVGEGGLMDHRDLIRFIAPKPQDVRPLMDAWSHTLMRLDGTIDPVVAAAVIAFGFVFIHPFDDGNGRIHRFLIHQTLARGHFTPPDMIFPVSAAILRDRGSYDRALEHFSNAIRPFIEWRYSLRQETREVGLEVTTETSHLYQYFDATHLAEFLYDKVAETIERDLREELSFISTHDAAIQAVRERIDMPDRRLSLFVFLCLQNGGRLSKKKRSLFSEILDEELASLEQAIRDATSAVN